MSLLSAAIDAFEDDAAKSNELVKSGTLRTTRGTALVAVSVLSIMALMNQLAPEIIGLDKISAAQKFSGAIAIGFIWAITVAADSLARGIATATRTGQIGSYAVAMKEVTRMSDLRYGFRPIEPALTVVLVDKPASDEEGWSVVASAINENVLEFCCVKGSDVEWRRSDDPGVQWTVAA